MRRLFGLIVLAAGLAGCDGAPKPVVFSVMGDVPYSAEEDVLLPKQIAELDRRSRFIVHVGDIKGGASPCDEAVYEKVADMLRKSAAPVFILPGDNEYNDCPDPADAWRRWARHFMAFDERWNHALPVMRQTARPENFAFVHRRVLFIGLNLVGGKVHDEKEWRDRQLDDLAWTRRCFDDAGDAVTSAVVFIHAKPNPTHAVFTGGFIPQAASFGKPLLLLHGDGHVWIHDRPFEAAPNVLRVQVDQGGKAPPLLVTVTHDADQPFLLDRRLPQ